MPAMDDAFWADLDAQIVAQRSESLEGESDAPVVPAPQSPAVHVSAAGDLAAHVPAAPRRLASDWTGVLDTLTAAKSAAQQQDLRLREQAAEHEALLRELNRSQQEVRAYEVLLHECRTQAEAKLAESETLAETRLKELQAEAAAQLEVLEARAQAAESRAAAAEDWLHRIEQASRALLPATQRAAA